MENTGELQNVCGCKPMHLPSLPKFREGSAKSEDRRTKEDKYYQEIGAEMIGNQLIIRVEKEKSTRRRLGDWDPPCDCDIPEIRRPSSTSQQGPRIVNAGDNNQIVFRIRSRTLLGKEEANYRPDAFAYKLHGSGKQKETSDKHSTIMVHPQLGDPTQSQQVHSDHITDGNQSIYLLRINKKSAPAGPRKRNIELEVRTPKPLKSPPSSLPVSSVPPNKSEAPKSLEPSIRASDLEEPILRSPKGKPKGKTKKKKYK